MLRRQTGLMEEKKKRLAEIGEEDNNDGSDSFEQDYFEEDPEDGEPSATGDESGERRVAIEADHSGTNNGGKVLRA